jgi:hypothetical protein
VGQQKLRNDLTVMLQLLWRNRCRCQRGGLLLVVLLVLLLLHNGGVAVCAVLLFLALVLPKIPHGVVASW